MSPTVPTDPGRSADAGTSRRRPARIVLLIALVAGAVFAAARLGIAMGRSEADRESLSARLQQSGIAERRPESVHRLEREPDPLNARLVYATTLVRDVLDPRVPEDLDATQRAALLDQQVTRLDEAVEIGREMVELRPMAWRAHFVIGASVYLQRSARRDDRLVTRFQDWEEPLRRAVSLAPQQPEPREVLTLAYLELWPMLSEPKRELARESLPILLRNRAMIDHALSAWFRVAGTGRRALEPLPETREVWARVSAALLHLESGPAPAAVEARSTLLRITAEESARRLERLEWLRERDQIKSARSVGNLAMTGLWPDLRWQSSFENLVRLYPPGPMPLGDWPRWNVEACLYRECPLSRETAARIARNRVEDDEALQARLFLATDDLAAAERLETEAGPATAQPEWALYWVHKAVWLRRRDRPEEARMSYLRAAPSWREDDPLLATWLDSVLLDRPPPPPESRCGRLSHQSHGCSVIANREFDGIRVDVARGDGRDAVIEARWDGAFLGTLRLPAGQTEIELAAPGGPGLHRLEIVGLVGRVTPRTVSGLDRL